MKKTTTAHITQIIGFIAFTTIIVFSMTAASCFGTSNGDSKADGSTAQTNTGSDNVEGDFEFELNDDGKTVIIKKYIGNVTEITIPAQIQRLPVTHIGYGAFEDKQLTSVTIPNSVTSISLGAFSYNPLTSVTIGANVRIDSNPFDGNLGTVYRDGGRRAGTYTRANTDSATTWTRQ